MKKRMIVGTALVAAVAAQAAVINWSGGTAFTADSDVSNQGTTVLAINGGGSAPVTLNGVTFQDTGGTGTSSNGYTVGNFYTKLGNFNAEGTFDPNGTPTGGAGTGPYNALSADYQGFVSSALWPGNPNTAQPYNTDTVTFSGLSNGQEYLIQLWTYDGRNGRSGFYIELDGDASNPIYLNNDTGGNAADGIGEYVIGTFTADEATQSFDITGFVANGDENQGRAQINAIQLRAIPEPSTIGLVAAFGGAMVFMRRRLRR